MHARPYTLDEIEAYYHRSVPELTRVDACRWRGCCPVHLGMPEQSFFVNFESGLRFCVVDCCRRGKTIDLEMMLTGADVTERRTKSLSSLRRTTGGELIETAALVDTKEGHSAFVEANRAVTDS